MKRKYIKPASLSVTLYAETPLMLTSVTGKVQSDDIKTDDDQTISWSQHGIWNESSSDKSIWDSDK